MHPAGAGDSVLARARAPLSLAPSCHPAGGCRPGPDAPPPPPLIWAPRLSRVWCVEEGDAVEPWHQQHPCAASSMKCLELWPLSRSSAGL